ncbi:hypothetical protein BpHYR1_003731 [Brachionus plicatilis]|uniref:Uncharacterized protein n=1 Tax=Brachionus plicatilis TaxID=10195 RepID=A0A3M7QT58_BRAPC|nr:hypothetical protein BpHYR1_003731 [Brachionus plicatilis]
MHRRSRIFPPNTQLLSFNTPFKNYTIIEFKEMNVLVLIYFIKSKIFLVLSVSLGEQILKMFNYNLNSFNSLKINNMMKY